jgi:creatinine amidohydrolase
MTEVEWWRLKAADINALAARGAVAIVPVGSTEQHGPHLPTQVDALLAGEVARRAAREVSGRMPVVVTPPVWTGLAEHHMGLGATISIDFATFAALLRGIVGSLHRQRFRRILLLNGHGGNIAALTVIVNDLAVAFGAPIATAADWQLAGAEFGAILERQRTVRHACEAETSMLLALAPELVDMAAAANAVGPTSPELAEVAGTDAVHRYRAFSARTSHGVIGDPRAATREKGEALLDAAARAVAALVANEAFWNLPDR